MGCLTQGIISYVVLLIFSLFFGVGLMTTGVSTPVERPDIPPCAVARDQADVAVHVGPAYQQPVHNYWAFDEPLPVIGRAEAADGSEWWQVALPDIEQAWVAQTDVMTLGDCTTIPISEAPADATP